MIKQVEDTICRTRDGRAVHLEPDDGRSLFRHGTVGGSDDVRAWWRATGKPYGFDPSVDHDLDLVGVERAEAEALSAPTFTPDWRLPSEDDIAGALIRALRPFALLCELHDYPSIPDTSGVIFSGSKVALKMGDLRAARRAYLRAIGSMETTHLADPVDALAEAMWQLLDDMGAHGQSVCLAAKAQARIAYEPFADPEAPLAFTLEMAREVAR